MQGIADQIVNIGKRCSKGNTMHELMHVLGFHHEQSRRDRDTYVTVDKNNIKKGKGNIPL